MLGVEQAVGSGRIWTHWVWFECLSGCVRGHSNMFMCSVELSLKKLKSAGACWKEPVVQFVQLLTLPSVGFVFLVFVISPDKIKQRWDRIYFCGHPSVTPGQADQVKGQLLPLVVNRTHTNVIKSLFALLCHLKNARCFYFFFLTH